MSSACDIRKVRPYQLACLFCRAGSSGPHPTQDRAADLATAVAATPDMPLQVCANVGGIFAYQDPGVSEDTPEGPDLNRKRDLDLLQWLDLPPGTILPARVLLKRLLLRVPSVRGICGTSCPTGEAWRGCAKAESGDYERGRELGLGAIVAPRPLPEMEADKECSLAAMRSGAPVPIRPHLLLCAICQYGGGTRPPFLDDNLPEFLQEVIAPDSTHRVQLVPGADWAMCAPCPHRTGDGACVIGQVSCGGLYNEAKDLNVLQVLGLTYGTIMDAREVYRLIFTQIPTVNGVCALTRIPVAAHSVWEDGCHTMTFPGPYEKGREELLAAVGCEATDG
jgi:hypothetical protein